MKIKQELLEMLSVDVKLFKRSARFIRLMLGYIQQVLELSHELSLGVLIRSNFIERSKLF